jgi:hypothetical protein
MANRKNHQGRAKQQPEDAVALLKADHQKVRDLFQQYESATDPDTKRALAEDACTELEIHAQLEEQIFYPAVNEETAEAEIFPLAEAELEEEMDDLMEEMQELKQEISAS